MDNEKNNPKGTVENEGIIDITFTALKETIGDIVKRVGPNPTAFYGALMAIDEGNKAVGIVPITTGSKGIIQLQIDTVQIDVEKNAEQLRKCLCIEGDDHNTFGLIRAFMAMSLYNCAEFEHLYIWGRTKSANKSDIPILIIYSKLTEKCFYSMKRKTDKSEYLFADVIQSFEGIK